MLNIGTRLGPYEILSPLGAGGMGEVYKARDTRLDRTVAIKVLPAHVASDPDVRQRFEREARAVAALNHPHICSLYDVGSQDGTDFLVMEYLEGETLADRLAKGALPLEQALRYGIEIADALDKAHRAGIVHRDLKPGNIMLTKSGAKLLDFGLAKAGASAVAGTGLSMLPTTPPNLTAQGTILGTFQYMAPEQLEGGEADTRTDIFAFGAVLDQMLTGRKAFEGKSQASLISAIMSMEAPAVSALQPVAPSVLDHIVKTCLSKEPDERWQSVGDLCRQLEWVTQPAASQVATTYETTKRFPSVSTGAAILLAVLLIAIFPIVVRHLREPINQARLVRFAVTLPEKTTLANNVPAISVSLDGQMLAFVAQTGGVTQIWLRQLDEVNSRALAGTEGAATGGTPIWSPDGGSIAFVANNTLKRFDLSRGVTTNIGSLPPTGNFPSGSWNQAGEILVAGQASGILRVSVTSGEVSPVTFDAQLTGAPVFPTFLGDGRMFLYSRRFGSDPGLYVASLGSSESRKVLPYVDTFQIASGFLFFARGGTVSAQAFDEQVLASTGEPVVVLDNVAYSPQTSRAAFSVSQSGVLAFSPTGARANSQFTVFSRAGQQLGTVGEVGSYTTLAISPDERSIMTARTNPNGTGNLWAIELARQVATQITFGSDPDADGKWSPDGKRLIYSSTREGEKSLYEISPGGGPSRLVFKSPEGAQLSMDGWSPDGRLILYHRDQQRQLLALPSEGDQKPFVVYEAAAGFPDEPSFSPDGKWLAFDSNESGTFQVYVIPFPFTGGKRQVSVTGGVQPRWRGDGQELYFLGLDAKIMRVDVQTQNGFEAGTPQALFETSVVPAGNVDQYAVTGDGQRFVVMSQVSAAQPADIQAITDWSELLKQE